MKNNINYQTDYYQLYKDVLLDCPYCCKIVNLHYIKQHLKKPSCVNFQNTLNQDEKIKISNELNIKINRLKTKIKFDVED